MNKLKLVILLFTACLSLAAQEKPIAKTDSLKRKYDRKEEIIYDGKRYRIHNCFLTVGPGFLQSSIRTDLQKAIGIDFQFPYKKSHFQVGVMMSGVQFGSNNNLQGHICYGIRNEKNRSNIAAYIGPSFYTGVVGDTTGAPQFYQGIGGYMALQVVSKFAYDLGLGAELFVEITKKQNLVGIKLIAFFSGAYRGPKKNVNVHVKSEN